MMFLLLLVPVRLNGKGRRIIADSKVVGRLTSNYGVQMMSFQLRDDEDVLDDVLRRGHVSVVH